MPACPDLVGRMYAAMEAREKRSARLHLGASVIGTPCVRSLVYSFRWCTDVHHPGRRLLIFDRGHQAEHTLSGLLTDVGIDVVQNNPASGKQYGFVGYKGHFKGSVDGIIPAMGAVLECKTYNAATFRALYKKQSVEQANPRHFAQLQCYMMGLRMSQALYVAVNKDTDELYAELVPFDISTARFMDDRARRVIDARHLPARIRSASKSFFICKMCDHRATCFGDTPIAKSCRSCVHSRAVDGAGWHCEVYAAEIPADFIAKGCDRWCAIS